MSWRTKLELMLLLWNLIITIPLVFADTNADGIPDMDDATRNIGGLFAWMAYLFVALSLLVLAIAIYHWVRSRQIKT